MTLRIHRIHSFLVFPRLLIPVWLLLLCWPACKVETKGDQAKPAKRRRIDQGKIKILATTTIIADSLRSILPDDFEVDSLMGPGVDPHIYRAKANDLSSLQRADLIVYNGLHLEGKLGKILEKQQKSDHALPMSGGIASTSLRYVNQGGNSRSSGAVDPHVWFDVSIWADALRWMATQVTDRFSIHRAAILEKSTQFLHELDTLDSWIKSQIASLPKQHRILVTAHDAFGYYGKRYGLQVEGVQGLSTSSEAGLADINRIVTVIKGNNIPTIFIESSVNPKQLKSIQERLASSHFHVSLGEVLYSDALGSDVNANSYVKMIKLNTQRIVNGLSVGQAIRQ